MNNTATHLQVGKTSVGLMLMVKPWQWNPAQVFVKLNRLLYAVICNQVVFSFTVYTIVGCK